MKVISIHMNDSPYTKDLQCRIVITEGGEPENGYSFFLPKSCAKELDEVIEKYIKSHRLRLGQ